MTVSSTISKVICNGDGSTTSFSTEFAFLANADITATLTDADGVETTWVLGTHYTLSGAGSGSAGTLTVISPPTSNVPKTGETLTIRRAPSATQDTDLPVGGSLSAEVLEQALDRGVMISQRALEELDRAVKLPVNETGAGTLPAIASRQSKVAGWGSSGNWVALSSTDDSTNTATATGSTSSRSHADRFAEIINVRDYGAVGDGATDDTAAINAAWTAVKNATAFAEVSGSTWHDIEKAVLYFPPGDYLFNPTTSGALDLGAQMGIHIQGAGNRSTRIQLTGSGYFIETDQFLNSVEITDLSFDGGKGIFRHDRTGDNVAGTFIVKRLLADGYTGVAVGSLSSNVARWDMEDCLFTGTATSRAVVVPDQIRAGGIRGCTFRRDEYHLVVPLDQGSFVIGPNNAYTRNSAGANDVVADVWLVGAKTTNTNAGQGLRFFGEGFSNENYDGTDFRILIAEPNTGAGSNLFDQDHATTDSGGYWCNGVIFDGCTFTSVGNAATHPSNKAVAHSYVSRVGNLSFRDCVIAGGYYPYWLEFQGGVTPNSHISVLRNRVIDPDVQVHTQEPRPCNVDGIVRLIEADGAYVGHADQISPYAAGHDINYANALTDVDPDSWALAAGGGVAPTKTELYT